MSEIEHKKGKLIPTGKSVDNFVDDFLKESGVDIPSYYESNIEFFNDHFYEKAVVHNDIVYEVECKSLEPWDDIFESKENPDLTINFEVKYYNGGCSFTEAIGYALKN